MIKWLFLTLGILAILYSGIVFLAGSGTSFFAIWLLIGAFFIVWALCIHKGYLDKYKWMKRILYGFSLIGVIVLTILCGLIGTEFQSKGENDLDYIIVLGAQVYDNGPSTILRYRLDAAIDYLNDNPNTICIVTGAQGYNEPRPEGEVMAEYLVDYNIDESRIIIEEKARNTIENIKYSKLLMENDECNVGIVTNDFHVFRAIKLAESQGLENVYGIAGDSHPLYLPNNVLRECLAVVKELIYGNVKLNF